MASKRMIRRETKRTKLQRFQKRAKLRAELKDANNTDINDKLAIIAQLEKMPRDSSHIRLSHRCRITGRVHGTLRKFELCRNKLREVAMRGEAPGLVKASW